MITYYYGVFIALSLQISSEWHLQSNLIAIEIEGNEALQM